MSKLLFDLIKKHNNIENVLEYIKNNLIKGYNQDTVRFSLISQGYSRISVEKAIENANKQIAEKIPPIKEKPQISYRIITGDNEKSETIEVPIKKKKWWQKIIE